MSVPGSTRIEDLHGPAHSGSGDQYNYIYPAGGFPHSRERVRIAAEDRRWLSQRFVRPRNLGRASERLAKPGATVLLVGEAGIGRRAAGTVLLHELPGEEGSFEELPAERDPDGRLEFGPDDRLLLDLSETTVEGSSTVLDGLGVYRSATERTGARLVVILSSELEQALAPELQLHVVRLERPRGDAVLTRYLRSDELLHQPGDLELPELKSLLATAPMRDIARLVRIIGEVKASRRHGTVFAGWCAAAMEAITDWSDQVARQVDELTDGRKRALLLAGAMLDRAPADVAAQWADQLLRLVDHPDNSESALAGPDLLAQLHGLKMTRSQDGRIDFERLSYGAAVRSHFWTYFPGLRDHLRDWVADAIHLAGLGRAERSELVIRFAEQALAAGRPDDLRMLAEQWTSNSGSLPTEAALLLVQGLEHEKYGGAVRRQIYQWAANGRPAPLLARVLTEVCRHELAATHPDLALTRLFHLSKRGESTDATEAVLELARGELRLLRHLLERIFRNGRAASKHGYGLLLDLLDPSLLRVLPTAPELELVWHRVLTGADRARWAPAVRSWLTAAAVSPAWESGPDVMVRAAGSRAGVLNELYLTALEWQRTRSDDPAAPDPARLATAERFWRSIDRVEGAGEHQHTDYQPADSWEVS
ncbi:hypothetical protein [Kitasatospora sp. CB02891]|uniref:hypothetical protein n=1 Tax=Kitasatospora sp. CB02891 TaxID=2020329 RepID=UPI000C273EC4|nr:hypothetical protein [Kitasatospora sp. CB02891]PJN25034.1 hypothetical protein CG736_16285 [Kitasatospora sp. CB02891]